MGCDHELAVCNVIHSEFLMVDCQEKLFSLLVFINEIFAESSMFQC